MFVFVLSCLFIFALNLDCFDVHYVNGQVGGSSQRGGAPSVGGGST